MDFFLPELIIIAVVIASIVAPIWALVDILGWQDQEWNAAGSQKSNWIVCVFLLGSLGALAYAAGIRPGLKRARSCASSTTTPGWYPDPLSVQSYRWYDGQTWTNHTTEDPISS